MGRLEGRGLELRLHLDLTEPNGIRSTVCKGLSVDPRCIFLINMNTVCCTCSSTVVVFKRFQGMMLRSNFFG